VEGEPAHAPDWRELEEQRDTSRQHGGTTDQVLIGLGIGPGTGHVRDFYPASVADVAAGELPGLLAELLEDVLADPARYRPGRRDERLAAGSCRRAIHEGGRR
jgi:hypothetical protein